MNETINRPDTKRLNRLGAALCAAALACIVALWAQPSSADRDGGGEAPPIDVVQNPDTGVIEVTTGVGGLPAYYFSNSAVSQLFEQFPEYQQFCAGGCEIDVINDVSTYGVSIPFQGGFGGEDYLPTVGAALPLPPAVSVESLACTAGSLVTFDLVATKSGTVATDYVQLIVEYRDFGDPDGDWERLLTAGDEEVFEVVADDDGNATLGGVEVPASVGGQTQIRIASRAGREPGDSGTLTQTINVGPGQPTESDEQDDEDDETIWGLWGAVPPPITPPLQPVNPLGGIHTTVSLGSTSGVVPGAWHVFEAPPCPTAEVPVVIGVTPCLHPIVMQQNPTPFYYNVRGGGRVRHDTSVYEVMRTVRFQMDVTQGADNGSNPQIVGWEIEAAGGYWYVTNPEALSSQSLWIYERSGSTVRVDETVNDPDAAFDFALEWVYSQGLANGRSRGWNIAVAPILDNDGYATEGMRALTTVTEATEYCTATPDAPVDAPADPPLTLECDIVAHPAGLGGSAWNEPIANVSFASVAPVAAGFEREERYVASAIVRHSYYGTLPIDPLVRLGDDGLYRFSLNQNASEVQHIPAVSLYGQARHRQQVDGAWSQWSDWSANSPTYAKTVPWCGNATSPTAPPPPPDPMPPLECVAPHFDATFVSDWVNAAPPDQRREVEYEVAYYGSRYPGRSTGTLTTRWWQLPVTYDEATAEFSFSGPLPYIGAAVITPEFRVFPGDLIDTRIRARGRHRELADPVNNIWTQQSAWSTWSNWYTHTTPPCGSTVPTAPPAPVGLPDPGPTLACTAASFSGQLTGWADSAPADWERENEYEVEYRRNGSAGAWTSATATTSGGQVLFSGNADPGYEINVRVRGRGRQRQQVSGVWSPWSPWGSLGSWHTHTTSTCPVPPPSAPAGLPDPSPSLVCGSAQFTGMFTAWADSAPTNWEREDRYEAEYLNTSSVWTAATMSRVGNDVTFTGPSDSNNVVQTRVRGQGRHRQQINGTWSPWSSWGAWGSLHTHDTPTCPAVPPTTTPAPPAALPAPTVTLPCTSANFSGTFTGWAASAPADWEREHEYEVEYRHSGSNPLAPWQTATVTSLSGDRLQVDGPVDPGHTIEVRIRGRGQHRNQVGGVWSSWSGWGAWSGWNAYTTGTCPGTIGTIPPAPAQPTITCASATATSARVSMPVTVSTGLREVRYLVRWYEGHAVIATQVQHDLLIGPFASSAPQTLTLTVGTDIAALFDVVSLRVYAQQRTKPNVSSSWSPWSALSDASAHPHVIVCVAGVAS